MAFKNVFTYRSDKIEVTWDGRLCIHIGECAIAKGKLFVAGRQPWCQPDLVTKQQAISVVKRCPSGALSYEDKESGSQELAKAINSVKVTYNGPLYFSGDLEIEGAPDDMPGVRLRAALCRCGHSRHKPFCDNSHLKSGFEDYAAVGEVGDDIEEQGGILSVKPITDGPLLVTGIFEVIAGSGRLAWQGTQAALCRCGQSKNKPFCDGSHVAAGFSTSPE